MDIRSALHVLRHIFSILLLFAAWGCAYLRPGENEPVVSRVPVKFRVEGRPVIHLLIDGCRADVLYEMLDRNELPNIRRYIAERGVRVETGLASLTSTTFAAIAVQMTGKRPAHLNFPGNAWFDRESFILRKINSAASVTRINTDIKGPTIAEIIARERPGGWSAIIADTLTRGAAYSNPLREWLGICYFLRRWRIVDRIAIESMHDVFVEANRRGTFPAYTFVHLIATDNSGHIFGPRSEDMRECLKHEDAQIGRLMRTLEEQGILDKVCVAITADHGMMPIEPGCEAVMHEVITRQLGIRCAHEPVEEETPRAKREAWFRQFRAIETTSGDRYCFVYLSNPDNMPKGVGQWDKRPSLAAMRRFRNDAGELVDVVEALRMHPAVGMVCLRDEGGQCQVFARAGDDGIRENAHVAQEIRDLFDSPRTGDVVVFAAKGWNLSRGMKGAHGGAGLDELRIPILIAGPGIRRGVIPSARAVDLVPTFLDYMGIKSDVQFDGCSFLNQMREPVQR